MNAVGQLLIQAGDKFLDLLLHGCHFFPHVQDDLDTRQIHTQFARKLQNHFQTLQILVRVQPRVAFAARGLQETFALVEAQRLRMDFILLRHGGDHVSGFRSFRHQTLLQISCRGSSGWSLANSRNNSRVRSSCAFGTSTTTSTISSPRVPLREFWTPLSRRRNFCPFLVPCGIFSNARPSMVGTSIFAPSAASSTRTGSVISISSPLRRKKG